MKEIAVGLAGVALGVFLGASIQRIATQDPQAARVEACRDACGPGRVRSAGVDDKLMPHCECMP